MKALTKARLIVRPFILILFASLTAGCASTPPMTVAEKNTLRTDLFNYLCKGGHQRRKVEVSWTAKLDSQAGQRLDIAQEKQAKQRAKFQNDAQATFGAKMRWYYQEPIKDYVAGSKLALDSSVANKTIEDNPGTINLGEANLGSYLANEFVLMVPQREHADVYYEGCLPQYGENQFLGYRDGKPVISALLNNQRAIWNCYAVKNTQVLQENEKFTARLDLNGFCKYARDSTQFEAK